MANRFSRIATIVGVSALVGTWLLVAETPGTMARADVPFNFHVQDRMLPAGSYNVQKMNSGGVIKLQNRDTQESVVLLAPIARSGKSGEPMLVFNGYSDDYFLSEIMFQFEDSVHVLGQGPHEKALTHKVGRTGVLAYVHMK